MNIFDVVGGNKGLQEDHVTAVLGWLLDPSQSHGCGTLFLTRFFSLVGLESYSDLIGGKLTLAKGSQHDISVNVVIEFPVSPEVGDRFVDIVVIIRGMLGINKVIAIENKIRSSSAKKEQLVEQYEGLKAEFEDSELSMVYITPEKNGTTNSAFEQLNDYECFKSHVEWDSSSKSNFRRLLISILEEEGIGAVPPMSYETKFVLKSFVQFISNDFKLPSTKNKSSLKVLNIDGLAKGLHELKSEYAKNSEFFIGFTGGINVLKRSNLDYLEVRPYKFIRSLAGGNYNKSNWVKAKDFFSNLPS